MPQIDLSWAVQQLLGGHDIDEIAAELVNTDDWDIALEPTKRIILALFSRRSESSGNN